MFGLIDLIGETDQQTSAYFIRRTYAYALTTSSVCLSLSPPRPFVLDTRLWGKGLTDGQTRTLALHVSDMYKLPVCKFDLSENNKWYFSRVT